MNTSHDSMSTASGITGKAGVPPVCTKPLTAPALSTLTRHALSGPPSQLRNLPETQT